MESNKLHNTKESEAESLTVPDQVVERSIPKLFQRISVEPVILLNGLATMSTAIIEQSFFIHKACTVDHKYSYEICQNITNFDDINKLVHITVSNFHQWNYLTTTSISIILSMFLGSWSDRRGRKLPLLFGLIGKFLSTILLTVNAMQESWSLNYIIYTCTLLGAITGAELTIMSSCYSYVTDITNDSERTVRLIIVDIALYGAIPLGTIIGFYIFNYVIDKSYTIMFLLKAIIYFVCIIYSVINLKWLTLPSQQSINELDCKDWLLDFFDKNHILQSIKIILKNRPNKKCLYLWICIIVASLNIFIREERNWMFLYVHRKFHWDIEYFSYYRTFHTSSYAIMLLIAIPLMKKFIGLKDTIFAIIAASLTIASRFIFALTNKTWLFYIGGGICGLSPIIATISRSMLSKMVAVEERGKVFAILSVFDSAIPFISAVIYAQVYIATITQICGIFWLTASTQFCIILIMIFLHISLYGLKIYTREHNDPEGYVKCEKLIILKRKSSLINLK